MGLGDTYNKGVAKLLSKLKSKVSGVGLRAVIMRKSLQDGDMKVPPPLENPQKMKKKKIVVSLRSPSMNERVIAPTPHSRGYPAHKSSDHAPSGVHESSRATHKRPRRDIGRSSPAYLNLSWNKRVPKINEVMNRLYSFEDEQFIQVRRAEVVDKMYDAYMNICMATFALGEKFRQNALGNQETMQAEINKLREKNFRYS